MKTFKKITLILVAIVALTMVGGHFYFDRKFTPPDNYLSVYHEAENVPIQWNVTDKNPYSAMFLQVHLKGIEQPFFMQIDFGSPVTLFYAKSLASVQKMYPKLVMPDIMQNQVALQFSIGKMEVSSGSFQLINYGEKLDFAKPDAINIIGTIGTDLLEKRITTLDFKHNSCSFTENLPTTGFVDFEFKKRRIILPARLQNKNLQLLYDSGSSNYELITSQEDWKNYRNKGGRIKTEKGNSWGNPLKVITAPASQTIQIGQTDMALTEVTYVEGTSAMQNFLMRSSGMEGMIGNKLLLNHKLILDCKKEKFSIE